LNPAQRRDGAEACDVGEPGDGRDVGSAGAVVTTAAEATIQSAITRRGWRTTALAWDVVIRVVVPSCLLPYAPVSQRHW
jgi:hypothetical protein